MNLDVKHFVLSHAIWIVAVVVGFIGVRSYLAEHDARLRAEVTIAKDEQTIKGYQDQITQTQQAIATLNQQMAQRDAQNNAFIQNLLKQRQAATTPAQQVAVLSTQTKLPAPIVSIPDSPDWRLPAADVQPLFGAIEDGAMAIANLTTCQADLIDQKTVTAKDESIIADKDKQIALKQDEITALKKPRSFWQRLGHDLKLGAISFAAGYIAGKKF